MGELVVVATPIGNLEDIGHRTVRVLGEVDLIVAEDTRITRRLLDRFGIRTPLQSFHAHSSPARRAGLVARLAEHRIAYVTDAGTPGLSDPGAELVLEAVAAGHAVTAVPGPSAVTTALAVSGMAANAFTFLGFVPRTKAARKARLVSVAAIDHPLVVFEAPHRLLATLDALADTLGDRPAVACRELTKLYEEIVRGPLSALRTHFTAHTPRGEFTLVIAGCPAASPVLWPAEDVAAALELRRAAGAGARAAAKDVAAAAGWPVRDVYKMWEHDR
ncbi:MAG: 16S rRNA (cytidine(1402)-2'-O)-methyltransferase [Ardenticatenales bacterium]|nr:16S rRNA (cytidine(1402)-2'-O)-methyltransferase [Ardenticatenales bacterium]